MITLLFALGAAMGRPLRQAPAPAAEEVLHRMVARAPAEVRRFYSERGNRPAWTGSAEALRRGRELHETLAAAAAEGLSPPDYPTPGYPADAARAEAVAAYEVGRTSTALRYAHDLSEGRIDPAKADTMWTRAAHRLDLPAMLARALDSAGPRGALASFAPREPGYAALRDALARYRSLAAAGGWPAVPPGPDLVPGDSGARVAVLRERLGIESGGLPTGGGAFDAALDSAVRRFQRLHGLSPDGVVGGTTLVELNVSAAARVRQLEMNLERWRWLPRELGPRYVMVNSVASDLVLWESDTVRLGSRVIIGRRTWPTPIFSSAIYAMDFSPYWGIPPSIVRAEVVPLMRRDSAYLRRQRIRVLTDTAGKTEVDPASVDWDRLTRNGTRVLLRQEPGGANPLGGVKFLLKNPFGVYLHGTPNPKLFASDRRAFSHGCVRLEQARELAGCLLEGTGAWPAESLNAAMAQRAPRRVLLERPVPVHLCYWTAWVDRGGAVAFGRDVYGWDRRLAQAIAARGRPGPH